MRYYHDFVGAECLAQLRKDVLPMAVFAMENTSVRSIVFSPDDPAIAGIYRIAAAKLASRGILEPESGYSVDMLCYNTGQSAYLHRDPPARGHKAHWRLIICLKEAREDGALVVYRGRVARHFFMRAGDAALVRVDREWHEVTRVAAGQRVVMAIGGVARKEWFLEDAETGADSVRLAMARHRAYT